MPSTFDIHFQKYPSADSNGQTLFGFYYKSAVGIRGFQKTINKWVKCLLTKRGTDLSDREYGTDFSDLLQGNVASDSDAVERITLAVTEATEQIRAAQALLSAAALPNDERLSTASVLEVLQTGPTEYRAVVYLESVANQGVQYVLPVTQTTA